MAGNAKPAKSRPVHTGKKQEARMNPYKAIIYDIDGTVLNTINMNMYPLMRIIKEETGGDWAFEEVLRFVT